MNITPARDRVTAAVANAASDCINLITRRQLNEVMQAQTAPEAATAIEIILQLHRLQTKLSKHANSVIIEMRDE
jgi:DNA polymerase III alpha subunit